MIKTLDRSFYQRSDVVSIARELLGKLVVTNFNGRYTSAIIVETEAYNGTIDKASHAFGGRNTNRTAVMFGEGGRAYVYLCYGIHHLFNVVTNNEGTPHAVLIRGVEPLDGIDIMLERTGKRVADASLTRGPGNVSRALGINTGHTGMLVTAPPLQIAENGTVISPENIIVSKRIGVDYAAEDALLPYRFFIKGNKYVSGNKGQNEGLGY
ncbi:MAG: DNA-3-methyladenine glycosylase [Bacteroidota bacterium]